MKPDAILHVAQGSVVQYRLIEYARLLPTNHDQPTECQLAQEGEHDDDGNAMVYKC
jgi:hypothetical protein